MAERGYAKISDLPIGTTPLTGTEIVEIQAGDDSFQIPFSELGGAPSSHATSHQNGGSDEIANSTPGAGVIPKADGSGTLNDWISPATTTTAGKVVLAADGESSASKPPASTDSRLSDARYPTAHGSSHTNGADQIPNATTTTAGLMSAADKAAFDAYDPGNLPSDGEKAALAGTYGTPGDTNRYVTDDDPRLETLAIPATLAIHEEARLASVPVGTYIDRILFNGEIYVSMSSGDIYKETGGTLVGTGQTSRFWRFFEVFGGELYCTVNGGDIYKMDGSGVFQPTGQTSRSWQGIKSWNGGLYAVAYLDDLYLMDGSGVFQATGILSSQGSKDFRGMDIDHVSGNLIIARGGDVCLQVTIGGVVSDLGAIARSYADVCDDGDDLWAVTSDSYLYRLGYPGEFYTMHQEKYARAGISYTNSQRVVLGTNSYNDLLVESHEDKNIIIPHGYVQMGTGFATGNDLCIRSTDGEIYVDLSIAGDTIDGVNHLEIESEGFVYIQKIASSEWGYCSSSSQKELSDTTPAIRAIAHIDQTVAGNKSATYAVVSNVCTVTLANHGHRVNHIIYADFTSGGGTDGFYVITAVTDNTFSFALVTGNTSGNVTLMYRKIRSAKQVHSAAGPSASGAAVAINLELDAPNEYYTYSYGCGPRDGVFFAMVKEWEAITGISRTVSSLTLMGLSATSASTWVYWNFPKLCVNIIW